MDNQAPATKSLPSIEDLFKQAWSTFKGTWVQLLILYLVVLGIIMGVVIVLVILLVIFIGGGIISGGSSPNGLLSLLTNPAVLIPTAVLSVLGFSAIIITSIIAQIGMVKIIGSYPTKKTLGEIFHESFILPFLGISLLSSFLIIGGYMVFIVPGILFSIYFSFALYEVILDDKKGFQALRSSWGLVAANFWEVCLRFLVLVGLYFGLWMILTFVVLIFTFILTLSGLGKSAPSLVSGLTQLFSQLASIPLSWFIMAYIISLYKELKSKTGEKTEKSIGWMIIVSLVGWVLLIGVLYLIGANASKIMPKTPVTYPVPYGYHPNPKVTPFQNISTSSSYTY